MQPAARPLCCCHAPAPPRQTVCLELWTRANLHLPVLLLLRDSVTGSGTNSAFLCTTDCCLSRQLWGEWQGQLCATKLHLALLSPWQIYGTNGLSAYAIVECLLSMPETLVLFFAPRKIKRKRSQNDHDINFRVYFYSMSKSKIYVNIPEQVWIWNNIVQISYCLFL